MFVGKSGGLQLTGFRCSCIFCSGSSAKHGGMVCKKNNATKREIQQNLRLKFFNLLLFYHNALANWSSFTTAGFFLFTFSYHQKKQIQSRRKPPTAYQGSKPLALRKGQNFRALKMWQVMETSRYISSWKQGLTSEKLCGLRSGPRGEKTSSDSIYQLLGWPPWRYAYIMWWAPKGFFRGYVCFLPETSNLFEGERWWESGDASRKNRAMSSQNGSLKWLVFSLFLCQSGLVNSDDNLTGSTLKVGEADAMIFWR